MPAIKERESIEQATAAINEAKDGAIRLEPHGERQLAVLAECVELTEISVDSLADDLRAELRRVATVWAQIADQVEGTA